MLVDPINQIKSLYIVLDRRNTTVLFAGMIDVLVSKVINLFCLGGRPTCTR